MHICLFNARSIVNKLNLIQSFIYGSPFKIIAITETWLTDYILDNEILPTGFKIFRNDRDSRGGGVLLAIHQSSSAEVLPLPPPHLEVIAVKLTRPISLVICVVCLPPNSSHAYCAALCNYLSALLDGNTVVILGDFNFPKINWHTLSGDSAASALFCEFVFDNDLDQLVTESTHCQGNTLDLILTNCSRIVHDVKAHKKRCIPTDHFIISFSIQTPVLPSSSLKSRFVYNFSKADFNLMADYLLDCNFEPCLSSLDV